MGREGRLLFSCDNGSGLFGMFTRAFVSSSLVKAFAVLWAVDRPHVASTPWTGSSCKRAPVEGSTVLFGNKLAIDGVAWAQR